MAQSTFNLADIAHDKFSQSSSPTSLALAQAADPGGFFDQGQIWHDVSLITGVYYYDVGYLRFDTSSLPDVSTITGATLRLYGSDLIITDTGASPSLTGDYRVWTEINADHTAVLGTSAFNARLFSSLATGQYNDITLTNFNVGNNISRNGFTYIRTKPTIASEPAGENVFRFWALNQGNGLYPQLVVDYVVGTTTRLAPDAILAQTNLTGAVSAIQDDPDAGGDVTWLTAP